MAVRREGSGKWRLPAWQGVEEVVADKGYNSGKVRSELSQGVKPRRYKLAFCRPRLTTATGGITRYRHPEEKTHSPGLKRLQTCKTESDYNRYQKNGPKSLVLPTAFGFFHKGLNRLAEWPYDRLGAPRWSGLRPTKCSFCGAAQARYEGRPQGSGFELGCPSVACTTGSAHCADRAVDR
jgi:hypothetical protein